MHWNCSHKVLNQCYTVGKYFWLGKSNCFCSQLCGSDRDGWAYSGSSTRTCHIVVTTATTCWHKILRESSYYHLLATSNLLIAATITTTDWQNYLRKPFYARNGHHIYDWIL
ncbi:hypothetical protein C5167_014144 [Papaver somniferum]|uniref:Uncharacterized protein n=1 Tax=Papaver somniferum TaxID=3469 RepID=A0A4Y7J2B3_PAPSO|nr:hypothetical protein C5167_014144 [Papaver somniferum]